MTFGRFEWLSVPLEEPSPTPDDVVDAVPAKTCPSCGWIDAETRFRRLSGAEDVNECWRCGHRFDVGSEVAAFFQEENIRLPGVRVDVSAPRLTRFFRTPVTAPRAVDLLLRAEALSLRTGYDTLLALSEARIVRFDHQIRTAIRVLRRLRGRALLADEVGLGKTVEAGLVIKELMLRGEADRVLILAPAGLTRQWQEEMQEKFDEPFTLFAGNRIREGDRRLIVSYDMARRRQVLCRDVWDILVMDEAHRLKNRSTAIYRFVKSLRSRYRLALTATPVMNTLAELYAIVDIVDPGRLGTIRAFKRAFVNPRQPQVVRDGAGDHLRETLSGVMIRNRRDACGVHFPKRRAGIYTLTPTPEEWMLYEEVSAYVREEYKKAVFAQTGKRVRMLSLIVLQRELMSSPMALAATLVRIRRRHHLADAVSRRLEGFARRAAAIERPSKFSALEALLDRFPGRRFLVFTEFLGTQTAIADFLKARGKTVFTLSGKDTPAGRATVIADFKKADGSVLVSTEAGGTGLNLQFCDALINFDLPWNPMKVEQRIGRIDRIGQTKETLVISLVSEDTIEAYVVDVLIRKLRMFQNVIGETGSILGAAADGRSFEHEIADIWLGSESMNTASERGAALAAAAEASRRAYDGSRRINAAFDAVGAEHA